MTREIAGIEWDAGNWPKCGKHGVSQEETEALLTSGYAAVLPDRTTRSEEVRYNAIGPLPSGRWLFAVFTMREHDGNLYFRPISARFMHLKEVRRYERQEEP